MDFKTWRLSRRVYLYIFLVNIFIYTKLQKWSSQKLIPLSMLCTHTWILLFLKCYLETVYVKNDLKLYFLERICYTAYDWYWQYWNKVRMISNGQLDSPQPLPTQGLMLVFGWCSVIVVWCSVIVCSSKLVLLFAPWS